MNDESLPGASGRDWDGDREPPPGSGELLERARRGVRGAQWELREWIRGVALAALQGWSLDTDNLAADFADSCIRNDVKRLQGYELGQGSLRGYLVRSVRRDAKRLLSRSDRESTLDRPDGSRWEDPSEDALILRRYDRFLRGLSVEDRLIWIYILEGETQGFVARILKRPAGTIACRVSGLKKKFRRLLNGEVNL